MTEKERKYLRKLDSRWAVAYPGDYVPWIVRGWFRWKWQAERHRQRLSVVTDLPLSVESAETVDRDWSVLGARWPETNDLFREFRREGGSDGRVD